MTKRVINAVDRSSHSPRVLIAGMFDLKLAEAATFADTLEGLDGRLCLVDERGRIIHANAAGQAILDARDILSDVGGRLAACDAQVNQTLRDVFAAAGRATPPSAPRELRCP